MSCTHEAGDISMESPKTIAIDETQQVLLRYPQKLKIVDDSTVAVINSGQKLSVYHLYSGKNERNFSLEKFNFDSLITVTYRKKYDGSKKFTYGSSYEINGSNYQLLNYYNADHTYYMIVSLLAQVDDLKDSTALVRARNSDEAKKTSVPQDAKMAVMDYLNFVFVTTADLKITKIIPLYAEDVIKKNNYYAYFHKHFIVTTNYLYVPVCKTEAHMDLEAKMNTDTGNYSFARIDLRKPDQPEYVLKYSAVDFSDYRIQDYFDAECIYDIADKKILVSTGKEIAEMESGTNIFEKKNLAPTEWIQSFYKTADNLVMTTYTMEHKSSIVISGHACPVDSLVSSNLKVFNTSSQKWIIDKKLLNKGGAFCLAKDKLIFITKDEKSYYLNYIKYHEN